MSFLDNLFSQYGQAGQYASDRMNGKNQTLQQRQWSPDDPTATLGQTNVGSLTGGDMSGQAPMQQMQAMAAPTPAPQSQPVAEVAPPDYGGMVQEQAPKSQPMDMGTMMGMLQGGMGSYKDVSQEKAKPGFLGGLVKAYLGGAIGGAAGAIGGGAGETAMPSSMPSQMQSAIPSTFQGLSQPSAPAPTPGTGSMQAAIPSNYSQMGTQIPRNDQGGLNAFMNQYFGRR